MIAASSEEEFLACSSWECQSSFTIHGLFILKNFRYVSLATHREEPMPNSRMVRQVTSSPAHWERVPAFNRCCVSSRERMLLKVTFKSDCMAYADNA